MTKIKPTKTSIRCCVLSGVRRFKKRIFPNIDVAKRKEDQPAMARDRERRKVQCKLKCSHGWANALGRSLRSLPYRSKSGCSTSTTGNPNSVLCFKFGELVRRVLAACSKLRHSRESANMRKRVWLYTLSFSRYKSEGFIKEISTIVALTCLLSLCDRSLVNWCHSVLYFARYPQPKINRRPISKTDSGLRLRISREIEDRMAPNCQRTITKRKQTRKSNVSHLFLLLSLQIWID